ncbi:SDR family NAD(P)-dependent oxidoreductase [Nonomuraea jabiensis]|uniref:NAD(P)-dependent dehydrogenase (Short-subunit alcohol dehydrogenase family) n=1 Tax=Nonomuraea jabiensis TaxID=882448 RepID=A0A7W9LGZ9_9ACTN|nr:SDR family NAD(P)-dependent oxidoreductase [Nonomuraea jabiensis]MBB5783430.1 NAD(P)-dependent dehydrogenase (short-subunit alcohol dehydrogenase family) [Nonomuraea jabiensis]
MTSTAKTIVISGGTDGMGRALASTYLDRGDTVVIIGRDAAKAATLPGAHFILADLSLASENRRVLEEINARYPAVDALVPCARYFRSNRFVTAEGVARHPTGPTCYVLINPGPVSTSFAGDYDPATAAHVAALQRHGAPVGEGIKPIIARLDNLTRHLLRSQEK